MDIIEKMNKVFTAIKPWREAHKGTDYEEIIDCPICNNKLHLSISSFNNHVWGSCESENCVQWME